MAVQDAPQNSVITAYLRGRQMREQKEKELQDQENEAVAQKQRQQQLDQAQKSFDSQVKHQEKQDQLELEQTALNKKLALHTLVNSVLTARSQGLPTLGLQEDVPDANVAETYSGMKTPKTTGSIPEFGISGIDLSSSDPIKNAEKQAEIARIKGAPALEAKQALADQAATHKQESLDTQNKFKQAIQETELQAKADENAKERTADFDREMQIAQLRAHTSLQIANIHAEAGKAKIQQGLVKLSNADQTKLDAIKDVKRNLLLAKEKLDRTGYAFFKGPTAILEAAQTGISGEATDIDAAIKSDLANGYQSFVVAQQGKTLTKNEEAMIDALYPTGSHLRSPRTARTNMEGLLQRLDAIEGDIYGRYGAGGKTDAGSSSSSNGIILKSVRPAGTK